MDRAMQILIDKAPSNELDASLVMHCLKDWASPRNKLSRLLKSGALISVKRGLYIFGPQYQKGPICRELLANKIYGPSYVSLEWALQYYGLIPEAVEVVTSVTTKRSTQFATPIGHFSYHHTPTYVYSTGVDQVEFSRFQKALLATKEKALTDTLTIRRGKVVSQVEMAEILFEDLRIEEEDLVDFDLDLITKIHNAQPHSAIKFLITAIKRLQS